MNLSIIIPSYKDPLLHRTVDCLLDNATGDIEVVVVIDGYDLDVPVRNDPRVSTIQLVHNMGMREAINIGVAASSGKYIMRTDEHCDFGFGYDEILTENIEDNWIVTPRRYKLNPETWERFGDPVDYQKMIIGRAVFGKTKGAKKFHASDWPRRTREREGFAVDETMAMQGSCWVMSRKHWDDVIVELQTDGYGTLYQDSTEIIFKTWRAGGKLMLNKATWYAHKAREFKRTHNYPRDKANASFTYALEVWGDYFRDVIKPRWSA